MIIAIDGPAGTGKGTISKLLAEELGYIYIDTGAMYRAVTISVLKNELDLNNLNIEFDNMQKIFLNGQDVTEQIRSKEVTQNVSQISSRKEIRIKLVEMQRKLAQNNNVVMEGRDIGTVVFPNADLKIYLDANIEERAKRRYIETIAKGINATYEEVLEHFKIRDKNDMEKEMGALKKAPDAIYIDSTNMDIQDVVKKIIEYINGENK